MKITGIRLSAIALLLGCWPTISLAQPAFTAEGVTNAAGYTSGLVSPGEIIVLFGSALGPADLVPLQVVDNRLVAGLSAVRVLFDGVPAPLVYVRHDQLSAIVPYAVAGKSTTDVVVEYQGVASTPVKLPVVSAVPGVFTVDSSGLGQGAILNQDGSLNSPDNPADLDEIVVLYVTGEGQTKPGGQDGLIATGETLPAPELAVTARLAGVESEIIYAGAAPLQVAGLMQVNARVSPEALDNPQALVTVRVDGIRDPGGVTMAVISQPDPLPPGGTANIYGAASGYNPDFSGGILGDKLLPYEVRDSGGTVVLAGTVQDRSSVSTNTGMVTFAPRLGASQDLGSGAKILSLEKTGFAGSNVEVEYRYDGIGDVGPTRASRTPDGDTVVFTFDPPLTPPAESLFPSIVTDSTEAASTAQITIRVIMPDATILSTTIQETEGPK